MIWQFSASGSRDSVDVKVQPPRMSATSGKTIGPEVEARFVGPEGSEGYMIVTLTPDEADRLASQLSTAAADARKVFSGDG